MAPTPDDILVGTWKQQLDSALRVVEATTEAVGKMRETQLAAAVDAHASAVAARKALSNVSTASEVLRIQSDWLRGNLERSGPYWRSLCDLAREANARVVQCCDPSQTVTWLPQAGPVLPVGKDAFSTAIDTAYKQWLDATRQLYAMPFRTEEPARTAEAGAK
jgi:phasin protein